MLSTSCHSLISNTLNINKKIYIFDECLDGSIMTAAICATMISGLIEIISNVYTSTEANSFMD